MISGPYAPAELEHTRWRAVRQGLGLANNWFGLGIIARLYLAWCLIGLILCFVLIPFVVLGKIDAFNNVMNPVALYGYLLPMALLAATTWAVKLYCRILWCGVPEPPTAMFFAIASVAGRLSVLCALGHIWLSSKSFGIGLLLPGTIACAGIAWLGLAAEWGFLRTLRHDFVSPTDQIPSYDQLDLAAEETAEPEGVTDQSKKSVFTRDLGEWFKGRFPRMYRITTWILLPLAYVAVSALAEDGKPQAILDSILRLAVIAPAIIQVFWMPGEVIPELISALSPKTSQRSIQPA